MRGSSIQHPAAERLVMIREWQVRYTGGNHCAAALLSFLIYWHDIRLQQAEKAREANDVAARHGDDGSQDTSLYQFHTAQQLRDGLMGLYSDTSIRTARKLLVDLGAVSEHKNPNPRYAFDATTFFLVHPEVLNEWLGTEESRSVKNEGSDLKNNGRSGKNNGRSGENTDPSGKNNGPSGEITGTSKETTSEITSETSSGITPGNSLAPPKAALSKAEQKAQADAELQEACRATWAAYRSAYTERYGVAPVRNEKVSSQIKDFVRRIGRAEAPQVAEWYVQSINEAWVIKACHDVGSLLSRAEAYRTQWATGRTVTATAASQMDKAQSNMSAGEQAIAILREQERANA